MPWRSTGMWARALLVGGVLMTVAPPAYAQSGPLTAGLKLEEPQTFAVRIGPLMLSPNLTLPAIGYEGNVFDDEENPKKDWTVTLSPDLRFYVRSGLLHAVAMASNDFTYFHRYASERFTARSLLGKAELKLSRFQPWIAAAHISTRERNNREIDLRARRRETELSTGVTVTLTPMLGFYFVAARVSSRFGNDQVFKAVSLGEMLSHDTDSLAAGAKILATPFTTVLFTGTMDDDVFEQATSRNSRSRSGSLTVDFSPEAIVRGSARVGYTDFRPADPRLQTFRGLTSSGTLTFSVLGAATIETTVLRQVQYSFQEQYGYYVETGADVTYTQRIGGPWDFQLEGSRRQLDYTRVTPGLRPVVNSYQAGLGYNFRDNSRIGLNYEFTQRIDDQRPDRRFNRRRLFGSYTYELR